MVLKILYACVCCVCECGEERVFIRYAHALTLTIAPSLGTPNVPFAYCQQSSESIQMWESLVDSLTVDLHSHLVCLCQGTSVYKCTYCSPSEYTINHFFSNSCLKITWHWKWLQRLWIHLVILNLNWFNHKSTFDTFYVWMH